ncbi:MAG: hypothetical protein HFI29_05435 [Lachnospiraceae bacterium]|jgi:hypothetical protein|nr:hypothetical protein [Lachnospiraceae bacterium]
MSMSSPGSGNLELAERIEKLIHQNEMFLEKQNMVTLVTSSNSHNITFKPPWEYLRSNNVTIMITTGYGLITATLNRGERAISNIAYHTKTGNINGEATVENGVVNIPASIVWNTTLMVFVPVKAEYWTDISEGGKL